MGFAIKQAIPKIPYLTKVLFLIKAYIWKNLKIKKYKSRVFINLAVIG